MTIFDRPNVGPPPNHIPGVPTALMSWLRKFFDSFIVMRRGKIECTTEITLTANQATSTLTDYRLSPQSVVHFDPKTANAAADLYGGGMYVLTANRGDGSWTITHPNNANADKLFAVSIVG